MRVGNQALPYTMAHDQHFGLFAEESAGALTGDRIDKDGHGGGAAGIDAEPDATGIAAV